MMQINVKIEEHVSMKLKGSTCAHACGCVYSTEMEIEAESPVPSPVREQTPEPELPVPAKRTPEKSQTDQPSTKDNKPVNGSKLRRRKRKLVPKTYIDDDGFMGRRFVRSKHMKGLKERYLLGQKTT